MITEIQNGAEIPVALSEIKGGAEVLIDTVSEIQNGAEILVYKAYNATAHNPVPSSYGFNSNGSYYFNQVTGWPEGNSHLTQPTVLTFKNPISYTQYTSTFFTLSNLSAHMVSSLGSYSFGIGMYIYTDPAYPSSSNIASGLIMSQDYHTDVTGTLSSVALKTGSSSVFYVIFYITSEISGDTFSGYFSAPAGCLTIGGIQLKKLKLI